MHQSAASLSFGRGYRRGNKYQTQQILIFFQRHVQQNFFLDRLVKMDVIFCCRLSRDKSPWQQGGPYLTRILSELVYSDYFPHQIKKVNRATKKKVRAREATGRVAARVAKNYHSENACLKKTQSWTTARLAHISYRRSLGATRTQMQTLTIGFMSADETSKREKIKI